MKTILAIALALVSMTAFAQDKPKYEVGTLQHHAQYTARVGTDFNTIQCDNLRCVGDATGIYATGNWWEIRVDGGYWELQPNWQQNSKHNPLNTAKEGDKILFRMGKKHYLNGTMDAAFLPRTDDPNKEIFLLAKWVPDNPVVPPVVQPKSQMEVACEAGKLTPDQQKQYCGKPESTQPPATTPAAAVSPMDQFKAMCESGLFKPGRDDVAIQQCDIAFPKKVTDPAAK
ncbi:MAG: hypothetical protein WAM79_07755 [Candidatus Sulfotelmatobacter sp.]